MENTNTSRKDRSSVTRREMLTTASAAIFCGEGVLRLEAQSPAVRAQRKAFFALWLLLSGRQEFFFIDTSGQAPTISCDQQDKITSDLGAFFTDPQSQIQAIKDALMRPSSFFNGPTYQAFRAVREFFHTLGTTVPQGSTALPPYQPGEICGRVPEIMALAGIAHPKTQEPGGFGASGTKPQHHN